MPRFLVESYAGSQRVAEAARERAQQTARRGRGVEYVRTTFIPGDEVVLHIFEAPSPEALGEAGRLAALSYDRIVEAVEETAEAQKGGST